jgi:hypothetical protein
MNSLHHGGGMVHRATLDALPPAKRILADFFQSVITRTAGAGPRTDRWNYAARRNPIRASA